MHPDRDNRPPAQILAHLRQEALEIEPASLAPRGGTPAPIVCAPAIAPYRLGTAMRIHLIVTFEGNTGTGQMFWHMSASSCPQTDQAQPQVPERELRAWAEAGWPGAGDMARMVAVGAGTHLQLYLDEEGNPTPRRY